MLETGRRAVDDVDRHLRAVRVQLAVHACSLRRTIDAGRGRRFDVAAVEGLRRDFLSLISYELRTSLQSIRAELDLVDDHASSTERDMAMEAIRRAYGRLESLVNRGLTYFDWLANQPRVLATSTDLNAVAAAIRAYVPMPRGPNISFLVSPSEASCYAAIDEQHIVEVLQILLDNAFACSRGLIHVRLDVRRVGDEIHLSVSDGGRGFPSGLAEEIFYPFSIADPFHTSRGTGLGLALARAIVQAHHGRIDAQSDGPGTGATFTVRLPACDERLPRSPTPTLA